MAQKYADVKITGSKIPGFNKIVINDLVYFLIY